MSFSKRPGKNSPQCYTNPLDSLKNWNNRFFWVDERVFLTVVDWRTNAPKDGMPAEGTYSVEAVRALDTHRTPIQKQPEMLLCIVGISRRYYLGDEVYPTFLRDNDRGGKEDVPATVAPGTGQAEEVAAVDPPAAVESRKRGRDGIDVNAHPKSLRRDHTDPRPSGSIHEGKSLATIQLGLASTASVPEDAPTGVNDPDPLSFDDPPTRPPADVTQSSQGIAAAGDPESENASSPAEVGSPKSVYRPEWGVTNGGNGITAALEIRTRGKAAEEVATLQQQVSGEEKLKAAFEDFKRQQDERVEQRCAEMDALLDALSIDFDEELYPHMLTAIAGRRWVIELRQAFADAVSAGIAKGLSEGLRHGLEHGQAQRSLESIEAYDPEAKAKFVAALQALKDLKYPLVDQLKSLKEASMDVIIATLYLESDTGDDASQDIRNLHPSSSQLTIPVYPEVRDPRNPWACKEEIVLADAIAANISRVEKKKKCRIVCRTHGVGSTHHARSDGVPVSAPTVVPQGLALLLADAATEFDDA
nr:hypothetical protein [Tanacetum cinerariifolium]